MNLVATIIAAATLAEVNPNLLLAVCFAESSHRNVINYNDGGEDSLGLCQVQVPTARKHFRNVTAKHLMDPTLNALIAGLELRAQLNKYGHEECGIVGYNQGSVRDCGAVLREWKGYRHDSYIKKVYSYKRNQPWKKLNSPSSTLNAFVRLPSKSSTEKRSQTTCF